MKIYCVKFDTMPFCSEVLKMAEIMNGTLVRQVSGCFTLSTLIQMFTGKQPSDHEPQGVGYTLWQTKVNEKNQVVWPWIREFIQFYLLKKGFEFKGRNHGGVLHVLGLETFPEFRNNSSALDTIIDVRDGAWITEAAANAMLGSGERALKYKDIEFSYIDECQKPTKKNIFYFISYNHYHNVCQWFGRELKGGPPVIELVKHFDFSEPDSLFWFFSDHGCWARPSLKRYPRPQHFYTWAIVRDNSKNPISFSSKIISAEDFTPMILAKFGDGSVPSSKNRIFFTEDGRQEHDPNSSTTAIACRFNEQPTGFSSKMSYLTYHLSNDHFLQKSAEFDEIGMLKREEKISKIDENLKEALVQRFKWVKG